MRGLATAARRPAAAVWSARGLTKRFGGFTAMDNVTLDVAECTKVLIFQIAPLNDVSWQMPGSVVLMGCCWRASARRLARRSARA